MMFLGSCCCRRFRDGVGTVPFFDGCSGADEEQEGRGPMDDAHGFGDSSVLY